MPRLPLHLLPMNPAASAAGKAAGVTVREKDHDEVTEWSRRPGSVRQNRREYALGARCSSPDARLIDRKAVDTSSGFSLSLSGYLPELEAETEVALATLSATGTATDSYQLLLKKDSAGLFSISARAVNKATTVFNTGDITVVDGDRNDIIMRLTADGLTLEVGVSGDSSGSGSVALSGVFSTSFTLQYGGNEWQDHDAGASAPVIDVLAFWSSYTADMSGDVGTRAPGNAANRFYDMNDGGRQFSNQGSDSGAGLFAYPAEPESDGTSILFGGESGAVIVEHSPALEEFWSTKLRDVARQTFSWVVKRTRREAGRASVIFDYGGLGKLEYDGSDNIKYTYNGVTITESTNSIVAGTAFTAACGRDGATIFLQVKAGATAKVTDTSDPPSPFLDFQHIRNVIIGADEDPALDTRSNDDQTLFAFYDYPALDDAGAEDALFYIDGTKVEDKSIRSALVYSSPHSADSGEPDFVRGPIQDASHRHISGGLALADSFAPGYTGGVRKALSSDVVAERVGDRLYTASQGEAHVIDLERLSQYGLEVHRPTEEISVAAAPPGVLNGAASYGVRWRRADGTYSSIKRLNPVLLEGAKAIIGSSAASGIDLASELGETYGQTGDLGSNPDAFSASSAAALTDGGNYPFEHHFWMPDWKEKLFKESVFHRGARAVTTASPNRVGFLTDQTAMSFDIQSNWSQFSAFRYQTPITPAAGGWLSFPVFGCGQVDRSSSSGNSTVNADILAFISEGHTDTTTFGSVTPRLVIGIARQKFQVTYQGGSPENENLSTNYYMLTFSNDSALWTAGKDYALYVNRNGIAIEVRVHNVTDDTWTDLLGNTMTGYDTAHATYGPGTADTKDDYNHLDFFEGWTTKSQSRTWMFGRTQKFAATVPFLTAGGNVNHTAATSIYGGWVAADSQVLEAPATAVHWHYRVWDRRYSMSTLEQAAEDRFAAFPGEPLDRGILIDFAPVFDDETENSDKLSDAILTVPWKAQDGLSPATMEAFSQDDTSLQAAKHPIAMLATPGDATADAAVFVYYTAEGDGSLVIRAGADGAYSIRKRLWSAAAADPKYVKTIDEVAAFATINDWDSANWYHFDIKPKTSSGTGRNLQLRHFAINGEVVFDTPIGGDTNEVDSWSASSPVEGWIHIGGFADGSSVPVEEVRHGEVRLWADGEGPDLENNADFDYLQGRVAESEWSGGTTNLLTYMRFQPDDVTGAALTNYGSSGTIVIEGDAAVVDGRSSAGEGSDPAPAIGIPVRPGTGIVAAEFFRTPITTVNDFEDDTEIQIAMDASRGLPMRFLVEVPVGSTHYVDNSPDAVLGFDGDERDGGVPLGVTQAFSWNNHICLLTDDGNVHVQTPGPRGWASFPIYMRYAAEFRDETDQAVAAVAVRNLLVLAGKSSFIILGGSPTAPQRAATGEMVGCYGPKCIATDGTAAYLYDGRLWRITPGQEPQNIGRANQPRLPAAADTRLVFSAELGSLFVIDESTGVAERFSFRSGEWSREDRSMTSLGDTSGGYDVIHVHGSHSSSDATVYGDDVELTTPTSVAGTLATLTITMTTTGLTVGMRVAVRDSAGALADGLIASIGAGPATITLASLSASLADGAVTVYPGAPAWGCGFDSGYMGHPTEAFLDHLHCEATAGADWQHGVDGYEYPGDYLDESNLVWSTLGDGRSGVGLRGKYLRVATRSIEPVDSRLSFLEAIIKP